ncbi:nucleotide sugar dehydrogenase [Nodularia spumigena]|uniref:nucleotide sugar dehydrogenase n=1 Tax=Nodularia spumigena TaxID=70799 RepID=UPI002330D670|nr:nucleotide sugar dehydrogenase [Nodularia spumigena]MDB9340915.1 nucleotide sugar dehydrogenase [Nodularia spumigena CS-589/07]MDB9357938.1 nucleotide sugar dehydrogenase [Nodularia spumigena CS-587/03]MDB9498607.1 nucleotide sugar dehydrogenase [Nodularia spumigena CS-336/02]MDB9530353.1 nucleotide sugar dehydrogenase [Nodularia spumigena CS-1038]
MTILHELKEKIINHTAVIGVIGLGYVGLPFAVEKAKVGFQVIGIEQNHVRAERVNDADNYISDVKDDDLKQVVSDGKLKAVTGFDVVPEIDVLVICVPTPLTKNLTPDLSYVEGVTKGIAKWLSPGQLVTLESTTYPGTTDEIMRPLLEETGLRQGVDFFLAHSPERVDPGNKRYTTKNTNKVVGASDPNSLAVAKLFYEQTIDHVVPVNSAKAAELVKVFENTFRAVNIALVNELALLCDRMGIDVWEVLDAANTKPFGIMPFYPGPGVGGHCIPIDPHYLEWKAKEFNFDTHFIALAGEINRKMPEFVREKTCRVLNKLGVAPSRAKVLILGVAYKKDLGDWRESPAIHVMTKLLEDGVEIAYHDSFVPEIDIRGQKFNSVPLNNDTLASYELVIITTDHSDIDYHNLVSHAAAVLDTRGVTRKLDCDKDKVTLL